MNKLVRHLFASIFVLIIASLVYNTSADPEWLTIYHIIAVNLFLGGVGFAVYGYHVYGLDGWFGLSLFIYLLCMLVLIGVVLQQMGPGFPSPGRTVKLTIIALLFLFFLGVSPRQYRFIKRTWIFLLAFAVLFSVHLYHAVPLAAESGLASFPIAAGVMMGVNLFVIPRYVSREVFLWVISFLASILVLIGIPTYYIGSYTFLGMDVEFRKGTFTPLFMDGKLNLFQSVFANPNTLGVVAFAGTVAAIMLAIDPFSERDRGRKNQHACTDGCSATVFSFPYMLSLSLSVFAGILFTINSIGMYLSDSRASFFATGISLLVYFLYLTFGRRGLPYALVGSTGAVVAFLFLLPHLGISASGRFVLWSGAIEAVLSEPKLLGEGLIDPGQFIAPYVEASHRGFSPHNSYLLIFIRAGLLGGGMYVLLIGGSLLAGVFRSERVDVPAFILAFGFAIHQLFEAYSLFQFGIPSVIGTLAFGYLILNGSLIDPSEEAMDNHNTDRTERRKTGTRSWSRPEWGP